MHWRIRRTSLVVGACVLVVGITGYAASQQRAQASGDEALASLVSEVRQLRAAVEQMSTLMPRIELTGQRAALEQDRVAQLTYQVNDVRNQLARIAPVTSDAAGRVKDIEDNPSFKDSSAGAYNQLQMEYRIAKRQLDDQLALEQQLRNREAEAVGELTVEQARWGELNARLDEIERLLRTPTVR